MSITADTNDRIDVTEVAYESGEVSVSTSQIEAKASGTRLADRQSIILYNSGNDSAYYGPTGVTVSTGARLYPRQTVKYMIGDIGVFLICDTGDSTTVVVQELA